MKKFPLVSVVAATFLASLFPLSAAELNARADALTVTWQVSPSLLLATGTGPNEIGPDPDRPGTNRWKSPEVVPGKGSPAASGRRISIEQERDWVEDHRDGTVRIARDLVLSGDKLSIKNKWTCKPTEEAFIVNNFELTVELEPSAEFTLIKPTGRTKVLQNNLYANFRHAEPPFEGPAIAEGIEIRNLGGGTLKIEASKPQRIELLGGDSGYMSVRFMEPDLKVPLESGKIDFEVEFKAGN